MPTRAEMFAQHANRVTAAVAFWAVAVLFVANISVLSGWLLSAPAAAEPKPVPEPSEVVTPSDVAESPPAPTLTPFSPLERAADDPEVALEGGATVTFPGRATQTTELVEIDGEDVMLSLHTLNADDGSTYSIAVIEYPESVDISDPAVNLLKSVSGAANSTGGRVVAQDSVFVDGAPGIEYKVEASSVQVVARNVLAGRRLYSQTVAFEGKREPEDAEAFFESLTLGDQ